MSNSFLHPLHEIHFGSYRQVDVGAAIDETEKLAWTRINAAITLTPSELTFENSVLAVSRAAAELFAVWDIVSHLEGVLGEPWQKSNELANMRGTKFKNDVNFNKEIYNFLKTYRDGNAKVSNLSEPQKKLLRELIRQYERGGINLGHTTTERLKIIHQELSEATVKFSQNSVVATDSGVLWLDEGALTGLDDDFIRICRSGALADGKTGLKLAYSHPTYRQVMAECNNRETRRSLYHLHIQRAGDSNEPLMKEILGLRHELAGLLGFDNFADYILEDRMVKTGGAALKFSQDLAEKYRPTAEAERDELQEFARELEHDPKLTLDASDLDTGLDFYYSDKLRESVIGLNEQNLKAYFQLDNVIHEMFRVLGILYGVIITQTDLPVWHDSVSTFQIYDQHGHHLSTVWCDWVSRPGKHGGAWMNQYFVADRANDNFDQPHLGYVCANFPPPAKDKPVLLTFSNVETIWHEFGHFMHATFGQSELIEQSNMFCRWDFVEAPSQIMENFVWVPEVLGRMARHIESGETLSTETRGKLIESRRFHVASKAMRQFSFAITDLIAHTKYDPAAGIPVSAFIFPVKQKYLTVPLYTDDKTMNTFNHIYAGGYSAAYYSYKWAEVIEADLFTRFEDEGPLNPAVGAEYRDKVLARGSEVEPDVLIKDFLGRDVTSAAVLKRDGIAEL